MKYLEIERVCFPQDDDPAAIASSRAAQVYLDCNPRLRMSRCGHF